MQNLDTDSQETLERRVAIGDRCIVIAHDGLDAEAYYMEGEDRETYAKDAISDILTALYGPEGVHTVGCSYESNGDAGQNAQALLDAAFDSYAGDAEDYTREPQPGEYGYESN
jgi:hypothetical protein